MGKKRHAKDNICFLNAEDGLDEEEQNLAAQEEAELALGAYWQALDGTLDPDKVKKAANNALIGNRKRWQNKH